MLHSRSIRLLSTAAALLLPGLLLAACAGGAAREAGPQDSAVLPQQSDSSALTLAIPEDARKPWEQLDSAGYVIPATDSSWLSAPAGGERGSSAINSESQFVAGAQFDSADAQVNVDGLAAQFSAPAGGRVSALYRLPVSGVQPGALSVDVNLNADGQGRPSQCWVGVADFAHKAWDWHLAAEAQTRFSLAARVAAGADYVNDLGNMQLAVLAYDGASFELVGLAANTLQSLDSAAPPVPAGLSASPVQGGLELQWNSVLAADLAGYRIYYSKSNFSSTSSPAVKKVDYLQGATRHLLSPLSGTSFVRISAVDISGNESALSDPVSAAALAGSVPKLIVSTSLSSGRFGDSATLTATGASSYDIDADGDGIFEITGNASGTAQIDTNQTGIIRPVVRGSSGTAVAHGAVSLIIAANLPPVAQLHASDSSLRLWGDSPVTVTLDASDTTDEEGASLQYAFDPEGDGSFTANNPISSAPADYGSRGSFMASVKVTDSQGLVGYAGTLVTAAMFSGFKTEAISGQPNTGANISAAIVSGQPSAALYDTHSMTQLSYSRARDSGGFNWRAPFGIDITSGTGQYPALAEIGGRPAVAYWDNASISLRYIRATTAGGSQQSAWSNPPVTVVTPVSVATNSITLAEVGGKPAILYVDTSGKLMYVRAQGPTNGDFASDWTLAPVQVDTGVNFSRTNLVMVSGNPAVAYVKTGDAYYKRCVSSTGELVTDWSAVPFSVNDSNNVNGEDVSMAVVNGRPAIAYIDVDSNPVVKYVHATNATGATQADWPPSVLVPDSLSPVFISLAVVDDRPAIASYMPYASAPQPVFVRALDADGTSWDSWRPMALGATTTFNFFHPTLISSPDCVGVMAQLTNAVPVFCRATFE